MPSDFQQQFDQMKRDIEDLKRVNETAHIEIDTDLFGVLDTLAVDPSTIIKTPMTFFDQVKLYRSGSTFRLYIYDVVNKAWRFVTLT